MLAEKIEKKEDSVIIKKHQIDTFIQQLLCTPSQS